MWLLTDAALFTSVTISGAIHNAKLANDALKTINFRAIKILVLRTHPSDDGSILSRKGGRLLTGFDKFCGSSDVASGPMHRIVNFAIPKRLHGSKCHGRNLARNAR